MDDDRACPDCGSTEFNVQNGLLFCPNGHQQRGGPIIGEDADDYAQRGRIVRAKKIKGKVKVTRVLHGKRAYQLFLQSWQHILWRQSHVLTHSKGMPQELWSVVRDLWQLRLSQLIYRLDDEAPVTNPREEHVSEDSTGSEADGTDDDDDAKEGPRRPAASDNLRLIDTIVLNYLGMLLLRQPVALSTVYKWLVREDVPFVRAIRFIPSEMKDRLPGEYHHVLDTTALLTQTQLQSAAYRIVMLFNTSFGMTMPPLNFRAILLSYIRNLALPLTAFALVMRLKSIVKFDFSYPTTNASRRSPTAYPEAQLMSLLVITTKLLFPFDPNFKGYHPISTTAPGALSMDWSLWLQAKQRQEDSIKPDDTIQPDTEMGLKDIDILEMSDLQMDQYMDWFQRTWTSPSERSNINQEILDMFPLESLDRQPSADHVTEWSEAAEQESRENRLKEVHGSLKTLQAVSKAEEENLLLEGKLQVLRPGMYYQQFKTMSELGENEAAAVFYREAAETACLTVDMLLRAVAHTEQMIIKWRRAKQRAELFGEQMDLDAEMGREVGVDME